MVLVMCVADYYTVLNSCHRHFFSSLSNTANKETYSDTLYIMHLHSISGLLLIFVIVVLQVVYACVFEADGMLIMQPDSTTPVSTMIQPKLTVSVTLISFNNHFNMFLLLKNRVLLLSLQ
jgi:hypothetical protein